MREQDYTGQGYTEQQSKSLVVADELFELKQMLSDRGYSKEELFFISLAAQAELDGSKTAHKFIKIVAENTLDPETKETFTKALEERYVPEKKHLTFRERVSAVKERFKS